MKAGSIKELQREKENKLKSMNMDEVKVYIERNVAYYYSHYANYNLIYDVPEVMDEEMEEAVQFQKSFNRNMEIIIDGIKEDYRTESVVRQMRINYVLCVLFGALNDNLVYNAERINEALVKGYEQFEEYVKFQYVLCEAISGFMEVVGVAYDLFIHCKRILFSMYSMLMVSDVDYSVFDGVNNCFKSLFLDFYENYLCSRGGGNIQRLFDVMVSGADDVDSVDDLIESDGMKQLYKDTVEKLDEMDEWVNSWVECGDLFSDAKGIISSVPVDAVVYDLKQFDICYPLNNLILDEVLDSGGVSDEFQQMLLLEDQFDVHILDATVESDASIGEGTGESAAVIVDAASIDDGNIEYLEEMLL